MSGEIRRKLVIVGTSHPQLFYLSALYGGLRWRIAKQTGGWDYLVAA